MPSAARNNQLPPILSLPSTIRFHVYHLLIPKPCTITILDAHPGRSLEQTDTLLPSVEKEIRKATYASTRQKFYVYLMSFSPQHSTEADGKLFLTTCLHLMRVCSLTRSEVGPLLYSPLTFVIPSLQLGRIWNWILTPTTKSLIRKVLTPVAESLYREETTDTSLLLRTMHGFNNLKEVSFDLCRSGPLDQDLDALFSHPDIVKKIFTVMQHCNLETAYVTPTKPSLLRCVHLGTSEVEQMTDAIVVPVREMFERLPIFETQTQLREIESRLQSMLDRESGAEGQHLSPTQMSSPIAAPYLLALPQEIRAQVYSYLLPDPTTIEMQNGVPNGRRLEALRKNPATGIRIDTEEVKARRAATQLPFRTTQAFENLLHTVEGAGIPIWLIWAWPVMNAPFPNPLNVYGLPRAERERYKTKVQVRDCMSVASACKALRSEMLPELYGVLRFDLTRDKWRMLIAPVWNFILTKEARRSVKSLILDASNKDGLEIDRKNLQHTVRDMTGLKEICFDNNLHAIFSFPRGFDEELSDSSTEPAAASSPGFELKELVWNARGLIRCVVVMDECKSLTRCLISLGKSAGDSKLRLVRSSELAKDGEIEVDLKEEYDRCKQTFEPEPWELTDD